MGSEMAPDSRTWQLWGKADPKFAGTGAPEWHPLLCHVLDVVACARSLFLDVGPDRLDSLAAAVGLPREAALPWLLFFVALHDLGKATPPFQFHKRAQPRHAAIAALGLDWTNSDEPHGELSVSLATRVLADRGVPHRLARWVARGVGAHHGQFVSLEKLQKKLELEKGRLAPEHQGRAPLWSILRSDLIDAVARACGIEPGAMPPSLPSDPAALHSFVADLAGFTTVADWLGSNAEIFHYV
ncbi:MAG: CRISPR-associated endonuclease Cas3'', partial [Polyangiaceae bacterium]